MITSRTRYWPHGVHAVSCYRKRDYNTAQPMTAYSPATATLILERIADGQSLRKVCTGEGLPSRETFHRWLRDDEALRAQYGQACQDRADSLNEELLDISNDETKDWQHRRLQIATRQWMMAKVAPKKYGEKVTHAGDPDAPLIPADTVDVGRRLAFLLTKSAMEKQQAELLD